MKLASFQPNFARISNSYQQMLQAPVHEEGSNFERVVDIGHGAHHALELLEKEDTFGSHALGVGVGVGSLYLGLNQLTRSSNTLDRIEGVGHLALAGESFTGLVPSLEHSSLHTGLGLVHGASELVTGAGEFLAARKQNNRRDQWDEGRHKEKRAVERDALELAVQQNRQKQRPQHAQRHAQPRKIEGAHQ